MTLITPLGKKLKLTENQIIHTINAPANYLKTLGAICSTVDPKIAHSIHLFVKNKAELAQWSKKIIPKLADGAMLWIAYPKKTSKMQTDLTRDQGWDDILSWPNLQWLLLISIDDTWSAFAFRKSSKGSFAKNDSVTKKASSMEDQYIDVKNRMVKIPDDLAQAFGQHPAAKHFFQSLAFTYQKEYVLWLVSAKREETRTRRLTACIDLLSRQIKSQK